MVSTAVSRFDRNKESVEAAFPETLLYTEVVINDAGQVTNCV